MSISDVVDKIEASLNYPIEREYVKPRATDVNTTMLDNTRARHLLGWGPKISFEEGVRSTVSAFTAK